MELRLSTVTIAKNEEEHLARVLKSVSDLADEIIVVDAESTDRTSDVARRFTEKVFVRPWPGYGPQKNFALRQATGDWVLFVDADEEVTPELAAEIRTTLKRLPPRTTVGFVKIVTEFLGRPLRHLWGTNPRLLRRGEARWQDRAIHEQVVRPDGSVVRLGDPDTALVHAFLNHPSHYQTLAAYVRKRERYTLRDAEEMLETGFDRIGKPVGDPLRSPLATVRFLFERALKQFARLFVKKSGFLDGWRGWLWCFLSAQYEYLMCKKYLMLKKWEDERQQAKGNRQ